MSLSEDHVEGLRKEIGEKMARDNEGTPVSDASESLKSGYRRGMIGFGSNIQPRHFGKGNVGRPDNWRCICGHTNRKWYRTCQMCGVSYELVEEADG